MFRVSEIEINLFIILNNLVAEIRERVKANICLTFNWMAINIGVQ